MIIKLILDSEKPLYQQIKDEIIYALAKGVLKENEKLPSVRQLAASLSINMHTVNKAYNQLAGEGFLTMRKGKGAIVNSSPKYIADEKDINVLQKKIEIIFAEAKCRAIDEDAFIKLCKNAFENMQGEN